MSNSILTKNQIELARRAKQHYRIVFFLTILSWIIDIGLGLSSFKGPTIIPWLWALALAVFQVMVTWRFARAIALSKVISLLHALVSPLLTLFQAFFLFHIYCRRTGVGIRFNFADNPKSTSVRPLWITMGILIASPFLLLIAFFVYIHFSSPDIEKVNDEDLSIAELSIPESENAYHFLIKATSELVVAEDEKDDIKNQLIGIGWDETVVRRLLKKNKKAISMFYQAAQKKKFYDPTLFL